MENLEAIVSNKDQLIETLNKKQSLQTKAIRDLKEQLEKERNDLNFVKLEAKEFKFMKDNLMYLEKQEKKLEKTNSDYIKKV